MNVSTHVVAPHTHLGRHAELVSELDAIFREYGVPPGIVQYSFVDRRPVMRYAEIITVLTPFPTVPSSELMEDIGRAVAPAQTRIVGLQSSYYPPVFPPLPVAEYAPNEDEFIVARSQLLASVPNTWASATAEFETRFKSSLVLESKEAGEFTSTLTALFTTKTNPDKPSHTTLVISCPALTLHATSSFSDRHAYALHSLSASVGSPAPSHSSLTLAPKYAPARDQRFDRTCNGFRSECTWHWEVLDDQLRAGGVRESETSKELIVVDVPPNTLSPLSITFVATLTATAGMDAIGRVHRTCWAPSAMQELQSAFDRAHPAVQVIHHVIKINIPCIGEMISDVADNVSAALRGEMYAQRARHYTGGLRIALSQDAGVLGRRGDEDEDDNSDDGDDE